MTHTEDNSMKITFLFNNGQEGTINNNDCAAIVRWWNIFANNAAAEQCRFSKATVTNGKGETICNFETTKENRQAA